MTLALAILPLILTLGAGWALVAAKFLPKADWHGIEILSFRLLIPVMLIRTIASVELSLSQFGPYALGLLATLAVTGAVVFVLRGVFSHAALPNPAFTTLFQTTIRWNGFIALAAAELVTGTAGLALIAVAFAVLIAPINVANIIVLSAFGTGKAQFSTIVLTILKNPLVIGAAIGLTLNISGMALPVAVDGALELIGRAALGVGLLAVGAGISLRRLLRPSGPAMAGIFLRLILGPLVFVGIAGLLDLTALQTLSGLFVLGVPAASNGYIVAKQMGGDAELYADILTWQTILSLALLPIVVGMFAL